MGRGRFRTDVRGLMAIVACFGLIFWSARGLWISLDPTRAAVSGLRSWGAADREDAARRLGVLGMKEPDAAIPPLIEVMGDDGTPSVRTEAARALGGVLPEAIRAGSAREAVRAAVAALIPALKDPDPALRMAAFESLSYAAAASGSGGTTEPESMADTIGGLLGDGDDQVRIWGLALLGRCGAGGLATPPAPLLSAMEDRSPRIRSAAIHALAGFRSPLDPWLPFLLRTMDQDEPEVRGACEGAIGRQFPPAFSPAAIPALVAAMEGRAPEIPSCFFTAIETLARKPGATAAVPTLLAMVRRPIDRGPDRARPGDSRQRLLRQIDDIRAVRLLATIAPGTPKVGEVVAALIEVARTADPYERSGAIHALAAFGPAAEPVIPLLIRMWRQALERADSGPTAGMAWALGQIAPRTKMADDALSALIEALDPRPGLPPRLRRAAIDTLPAFGAEAARALPRLRELREDPDAGVRLAAEQAVKAIEKAMAGSQGGGNPPSVEKRSGEDRTL